VTDGSLKLAFPRSGKAALSANQNAMQWSSLKEDCSY
jgi:hypothetical protein